MDGFGDGECQVEDAVSIRQGCIKKTLKDFSPHLRHSVAEQCFKVQLAVQLTFITVQTIRCFI